MTFFFLYVADVTVQKIRHLPVYFLWSPLGEFIWESNKKTIFNLKNYLKNER